MDAKQVKCVKIVRTCNFLKNDDVLVNTVISRNAAVFYRAAWNADTV